MSRSTAVPRTWRPSAPLFAFFALLLPLSLSASSPSLLAPPASPSIPAILGRVVDSTGAPIANARVILAELGRATTTNVQGAFAFRGLPAGEYHLNATMLGFAPGHAVVRLAAAGADAQVTIRLIPTPLRLSSVVVSASPTGSEAAGLSQSTVELSGRALERQLSSSIAATLASEPGVSQRYAGPAASMPVIRGLTGDRILVLQDGERSGDLSASASDHAVPVDPLAAQRMEVVRGPASLLYGNSALGGVVNVISNDIPTAVPSHVEGYVGVQGETVTPGAAASIGLTMDAGKRGALAIHGGSRAMQDLRTGGGGQLDGTDSRTANATVGYGFIGDRATLGAAIKLYDFEYGLPAPAGDPDAGIRIAGERVGGSVKGGVQLGWTALPYVRLEGTTQDYQHDEIEPDGAIGTNFRLRTQTLNAQGTTALGRVKGAIGVQSLFKRYSATGDEALTPGANSTGVGVFLFQEVPLGRGDAHDGDEGHVEGGAQVQFGARYDDYRISSQASDPKFGAPRTLSFGSASGSFGVSVPIGRVVTLSGSVARAFRAPTVEELFSHAMHAAVGTYDVGNPALRAEKSAGAEAILRLRGSRLTAQLSTYLNRIDDYVTPNIVGDTLVDGELVPLNRYGQADAELKGIEGSVEVQLGQQVVASLMGDVVRGAFRGGGALPFMPPARVGAGIRWESGRFFASTEARHAFAQERVSGGTVDVPTDAYTLVNLSVGTHWTIAEATHQVTLRADNVGDTRYFDSASRIKSYAPSPGRNVSLVYRVAF